MKSGDIDILTLGLPEAWNMYKMMTERGESYRLARFGVSIKFDINDYLKGRILTKSKVGLALIRGKTCKLEDFETELESREKIIKEFLVDNFHEEDLIKPRGG